MGRLSTLPVLKPLSPCTHLSTDQVEGTNSWWLGHLPEDDDVQTALSEIAAVSTYPSFTFHFPAKSRQTGFLVTRVWGFGNINDPSASNGQVYYQVLNETLYQSGQKINYNATNGSSSFRLFQTPH